MSRVGNVFGAMNVDMPKASPIGKDPKDRTQGGVPPKLQTTPRRCATSTRLAPASSGKTVDRITISSFAKLEEEWKTRARPSSRTASPRSPVGNEKCDAYASARVRRREPDVGSISETVWYVSRLRRDRMLYHMRQLSLFAVCWDVHITSITLGILVMCARAVAHGPGVGNRASARPIDDGRP